MPESTGQRVTRSYRRGYLNALREAALDAKARGDVGKEGGTSTAFYLATRANHFELNGVPRKDTP